MLDFTLSFLAWLASTTIPAFLGLTGITRLGTRIRPRYLAAFALGIFLWFFVDTIGGSANLDVNAGFSGGAAQLAIVLLFVAGVLVFISIDRRVLSAPQGGTYPLAIPLMIAVAVGIHGFGEGTAFGDTAFSTSSATLLEAFGGVTAAVAYVLHKVLEPMMIGACYLIYAGKDPKYTGVDLKDMLLLALVFAAPSMVGAATGYHISYDATYFFALGTGSSIYAALRLVRPLFAIPEGSSTWDTAWVALWLVLGFISIYVAALFHSG